MKFQAFKILFIGTLDRAFQEMSGACSIPVEKGGRRRFKVQIESSRFAFVLVNNKNSTKIQALKYVRIPTEKAMLRKKFHIL